jgi:hypothetical protein
LDTVRKLRLCVGGLLIFYILLKNSDDLLEVGDNGQGFTGQILLIEA